MAGVSHNETSQETGRNASIQSENERINAASIRRYIITRLPTLVPPMNPAPNPIKMLALLNRQQWLFFLVCLSLKKNKRRESGEKD